MSIMGKNDASCIVKKAIKMTFQLQNQVSRPNINRVSVIVEKKHAVFTARKIICVKSLGSSTRTISHAVRVEVNATHTYNCLAPIEQLKIRPNRNDRSAKMLTISKTPLRGGSILLVRIEL